MLLTPTATTTAPTVSQWARLTALDRNANDVFTVPASLAGMHVCCQVEHVLLSYEPPPLPLFSISAARDERRCKCHSAPATVSDERSARPLLKNVIHQQQ